MVVHRIMKPFNSLDKDFLDSLEIQSINTNKKITYLNIECAFDIETSSMIINDEKFACSYIFINIFNSYIIDIIILIIRY